MASPEPARLEVRGLGFRYGDRAVLHNVDLNVEPGEVVGLLGPNGSGKSTMIKLLSGVLRHDAGRIHLDGTDLRSIERRDLARRVAVVPQEMSFGFPFSAIEVVLMGRHPHLAGLAFEAEADLESAREALRRCGAERFATRIITELSAGERQRVVFAKALAQDTPVLLLDEPASFLDIRHQVELYDIVREAVEQKRIAVLTVMHDLNLAAEYCDRVYLLREGRIEAHGMTEEVMTYANLTRVFGTDVYVDVNALTGKLLVVPLSGRVQARLRDSEDSSRR